METTFDTAAELAGLESRTKARMAFLACLSEPWVGDIPGHPFGNGPALPQKPRFPRIRSGPGGEPLRISGPLRQVRETVDFGPSAGQSARSGRKPMDSEQAHQVALKPSRSWGRIRVSAGAGPHLSTAGKNCCRTRPKYRSAVCFRPDCVVYCLCCRVCPRGVLGFPGHEGVSLQDHTGKGVMADTTSTHVFGPLTGASSAPRDPRVKRESQLL